MIELLPTVLYAAMGGLPDNKLILIWTGNIIELTSDEVQRDIKMRQFYSLGVVARMTTQGGD
ncbi:unnamed protein product [Clonostachys rosea f. rosea IK726]|uniref:Uncharacterized protein n=1 Tax=Clonostachys rosea f. rosea IK726 TaxID=1349383 RepID=A0ACA9UHN3_BIOOC|nr:unnamed protein product [Clonostachys rosea f. rosea IK726]